jgi:preprotein translocase subunit SecF
MFAITYRKIFLTIAVAVMLISAGLIALLGLRPGIDFTGGALTEVAYTAAPTQVEVEAAVATVVPNSGFSVRASTDEAGRSAYIVRTRDLSEDERVALGTAVAELGKAGEVSRFTSIGPVIGQELRDKAGWAIFGVVLIIVLYVAFAFAGIGTPVSSWVYGGITIFVLIHDVLVPAALMSVLGYFVGIEIDVLFVMALLAVLGYSVNDTIVVFDRVRENLKQNRTEHRKKTVEPGGLEREEVTYTLTKPYSEIVGQAVSDTLARSINTSITTTVTLLALFFFGAAVTQTFALVLLAGVLAGTYSSICIASPFVVTYALRKSKQNEKQV